MEIIDSIYDNYAIKVKNVEEITKKSYRIICDNDNCFFIKNSLPEMEAKFDFLSNIGVNNIFYPIINKNRNFLTNTSQNSYYISDYIDKNIILEETSAYNLFQSLDYLHDKTTIKKQLSVSKTRPKFEEITKQLDYKFKLIEKYIRIIENTPLNKEKMLILENYHTILDAKGKLIDLQKKIIHAIKDKESVDYVFVHNNPKTDHLIMSKGMSYLTSMDHGKIGINSLDMAKFYIENEYLELDFKKILLDDYYVQKNHFYYNYFRFMVLFIYIKYIQIDKMIYFILNNFINCCQKISKFMDSFPDID